MVHRLGKNINGYHGETIEIRSVLREIATSAAARGWTAEAFHRHHELDWLALHRQSESEANRKRVHISAGIHGDEPAGPLAVVALVWAGVVRTAPRRMVLLL